MKETWKTEGKLLDVLEKMCHMEQILLISVPFEVSGQYTAFLRRKFCSIGLPKILIYFTI
jgi:hypothetical protein